MLQGKLAEAEGEATRLKGSLSKVEEKVSLSKCRVLEATTRWWRLSGREKTSVRSSLCLAKMFMPRIFDDARGKW